MKGLLGGYGNSENKDDGDHGSPEALVGLGQYEESKGEGEFEVPNLDNMDDSEGTGSDDEVIDPAALMEQLKSAGFAFDPAVTDDEEVNWGDDDP